MARNQPKIYRQKNVKRIILRILLCILIALFVFSFIALLGFRKYIAYSETGKLYLDIPWLYEYMDGKPETDDLAQYMTPGDAQEPEQDAVVTDASSGVPDTGGDTAKTPEAGASDEPAANETPADQVNEQ